MRRDDGFDHPSGKECLGPLKSQKHRPAVYPLLVLAPRVRLAENQTAARKLSRRTFRASTRRGYAARRWF